jgi:cyclin-dependent kinase-like
MENYEFLGQIGEGTYGMVLKARHRVTGLTVAIKKFKESDHDEQVRKTALREIRILKQLKHPNIVTLHEVFRRKGKLYLVFEYVDGTILELMESRRDGLDKLEVKKCVFQLLKSLDFIHSNNIVHRDIKPENLLISKNGVLKLCDFGFARTLGRPGAKYTDYVATRWYRAPELLVGDEEYSTPVDVWAVGCLFGEISNGMPLFPGESDLDQLYHMMKCLGKLTSKHVEVFKRNPLYAGMKLPDVEIEETLATRFAELDRSALSLMEACLRLEPEKRDNVQQLLQHAYFKGFKHWFDIEHKKDLERDRVEAEEASIRALKRRRRKKKHHSSSHKSSSHKSSHISSHASEEPRSHAKEKHKTSTTKHTDSKHASTSKHIHSSHPKPLKINASSSKQKPASKQDQTNLTPLTHIPKTKKPKARHVRPNSRAGKPPGSRAGLGSRAGICSRAGIGSRAGYTNNSPQVNSNSHLDMKHRPNEGGMLGTLPTLNGARLTALPTLAGDEQDDQRRRNTFYPAIAIGGMDKKGSHWGGNWRHIGESGGLPVVASLQSDTRHENKTKRKESKHSKFHSMGMSSSLSVYNASKLMIQPKHKMKHLFYGGSKFKKRFGA